MNNILNYIYSNQYINNIINSDEKWQVFGFIAIFFILAYSGYLMKTIIWISFLVAIFYILRAIWKIPKAIWLNRKYKNS